jgi:predicted small secreted protein
MKKSQNVAISLFIISFLMLSGCNTVKGMGQDLQAGGKQLQKAADDDSSDTSHQNHE